MNVRSFMCAPLWNRNDVIGVLYVDNPRIKQFVAEDLDVFTALAQLRGGRDRAGAAVASSSSRRRKRRERLQRYHSPGVVNRILHGGRASDRHASSRRSAT